MARPPDDLRVTVDGVDVGAFEFDMRVTRTIEPRYGDQVAPHDLAQPIELTGRLTLDEEGMEAWRASLAPASAHLIVEQDVPWPALWTRYTAGHRELRRDRRRRGLPEPEAPVTWVRFEVPRVRFVEAGDGPVALGEAEVVR